MILVNYAKLRRLIIAIYKFYDSNTTLIDAYDTYKNNIPKAVLDDKESLLRYLFFSTVLNWGVRSSTLLRKYYELYKVYGNKIIDPCYLANRKSFVRKLIYNLGLPHKDKRIEQYLSAAVYICEKYNGKLLNMLENVNSYIELYNSLKLMNRSFIKKTLDLFIRLLIDYNYVPHQWSKDLLIPIDRNDLKLLRCFKIVNKGSYNHRLIYTIQKHIQSICNELGINPSIIDKTLWVLGSKLCKDCTECYNLLESYM